MHLTVQCNFNSNPDKYLRLLQLSTAAALSCTMIGGKIDWYSSSISLIKFDDLVVTPKYGDVVLE